MLLVSKKRTRKRTQKRTWVRFTVSPGTASPIYGDRPITAAGCAKSAQRPSGTRRMLEPWTTTN